MGLLDWIFGSDDPQPVTTTVTTEPTQNITVTTAPNISSSMAVDFDLEPIGKALESASIRQAQTEALKVASAYELDELNRAQNIKFFDQKSALDSVALITEKAASDAALKFQESKLERELARSDDIFSRIESMIKSFVPIATVGFILWGVKK